MRLETSSNNLHLEVGFKVHFKFNLRQICARSLFNRERPLSFSPPARTSYITVVVQNFSSSAIFCFLSIYFPPPDVFFSSTKFLASYPSFTRLPPQGDKMVAHTRILLTAFYWPLSTQNNNYSSFWILQFTVMCSAKVGGSLKSLQIIWSTPSCTASWLSFQDFWIKFPTFFLIKK